MNAIAMPYQRLFVRKPDLPFDTFDDLYTETLREKDYSTYVGYLLRISL